MVTVQELRKMVRSQSSDKAKFFAGKCSLKKMLTNGFGATLVLKKPINLRNKQIVNNIILDACGLNAMLYTLNNTSGVEIRKTTIVNSDISIVKKDK